MGFPRLACARGGALREPRRRCVGQGLRGVVSGRDARPGSCGTGARSEEFIGSRVGSASPVRPGYAGSAARPSAGTHRRDSLRAGLANAEEWRASRCCAKCWLRGFRDDGQKPEVSAEPRRPHPCHRLAAHDELAAPAATAAIDQARRSKGATGKLLRTAFRVTLLVVAPQAMSSCRHRMLPSVSSNQAAFSLPSTQTCSTVFSPGRS
jgi:hypothetical protein